MSVNLLDLAKGYLTDAVIGKAASFLGESTEATQSGLTHALPALLGGLMGKANSSSGASDLLGLLGKPELDSLLGNVGDLFGGSNNGLMSLGGSLLNSVLGGKLPGIADLIGNTAGFKNGNSTTGLLKMAMPLLMGVVGKQVGNSGLSGLMNLLGGQKDYLEKAAPAGFLDKILGGLGIASLGDLTSNLGNLAGNLTNSASNAAKGTENAIGNAADDLGKGAKKGGNKMLPILGLLAALGLAFFAYKSCNTSKAVHDVVDTVKTGADKVVDVAKDGANAVKDGANAVINGADAIYNAGADLVGKTVEGFENLGEFVSRKLSNGTELIIPNKGFEYQLVDFIESDKKVDKSTWFDMRRVLFKTASADLDERSMNQIENVANILKAYPNVNLKLGGYTDNTGNPAANKTLSANRANAVMKALIAKGISADRLAAEGYGQEHPIASNDTEEGKQLNRRVSARVTKK